METRIQEWENSLALRIPQDVAAAKGLETGTVVDVRVVGRHINFPSPSLEDLLALVTPPNIHAGIDDGGPVGREVI